MVAAGAGRRVLGFGWLAPALRAALEGGITGFSEGFLLRIILYFDVVDPFDFTAPAKVLSGRYVTDSDKNGKFLARGWHSGGERQNDLRPLPYQAMPSSLIRGGRESLWVATLAQGCLRPKGRPS